MSKLINGLEIADKIRAEDKERGEQKKLKDLNIDNYCVGKREVVTVKDLAERLTTVMMSMPHDIIFTAFLVEIFKTMQLVGVKIDVIRECLEFSVDKSVQFRLANTYKVNEILNPNANKEIKEAARKTRELKKISGSVKKTIHHILTLRNPNITKRREISEKYGVPEDHSTVIMELTDKMMKLASDTELDPSNAIKAFGVVTNLVKEDPGIVNNTQNVINLGGVSKEGISALEALKIKKVKSE